MTQSPYINDILCQPDALRKALASYPAGSLKNAAERLAKGEFDRIIITGMGASYMGTLPASEILSQSGLPVLWMDTADLLHIAWRRFHAYPSVVISQSGTVRNSSPAGSDRSQPPLPIEQRTIWTARARHARLRSAESRRRIYRINEDLYQHPGVTQLAALELMENH